MITVSLCIFGSRSAFPTIDEIDDGVSLLSQRCNANLLDDAIARRLEVLSGKCRGADACGEAWAARARATVVPFPADWARYGTAAGPIRNRAMAARATHALGFVDVTEGASSPGTRDMQAQLERLGKPVLLLEWRSA